MDKIVCSICKTEYDDAGVIPGRMSCGHLFCLPCILSMSSCPTCNIETSEKDFLTDFSLLKVSSHKNKENETMPNVSISQCKKEIRILCKIVTQRVKDLTEEIESKKLLNDKLSEEITDQITFKNKLGNLIETKLILKKKVNEEIEAKSKLIQSLNKDFDKLKELKTTKGSNMNLQKVTPIIFVMKELYFSNEDDVITPTPLTDLKISSESIITLKITDFKHNPTFLREIRKKAENGDSIYTFKQIENGIRYGKISLKGPNLLLHSISKSREEISSQIIWRVPFQDIRTAYPYTYGLDSFLLVETNPKGSKTTILIRLEASRTTPQFAYLSTGEHGSFYQGAKMRSGDVGGTWGSLLFSVDGYVDREGEKKGQSETFFGCCLKRECKPKEVLVRGWSDGSFSIIKMNARHSLPYIVGKVTSPSSVSAESFSFGEKGYLKIIDSGICLDAL